MTTHAKLIATTIDCADPKGMAEFWHQVTGLPVQVAEEEYSAVGDGTANLYFGRLDGYKPLPWPSDEKQFHLDVRVPDVLKAVEEYVAIGAVRPEFQPGVTDGKIGWIILQDPEGHVFCVCPEAS